MGFFKGIKLFKSSKSAKKDAPTDAAPVEEKTVVEPVAVAPAEPIAEPAKEIAEPTEPKAEVVAAAEDTVEALPEVKTEELPAKDDASTVAESKDGDAPASQEEAGTEKPTEESLEVVDRFVLPAAVAVDENTAAKPTGWFS